MFGITDFLDRPIMCSHSLPGYACGIPRHRVRTHDRHACQRLVLNININRFNEIILIVLFVLAGDNRGENTNRDIIINNFIKYDNW